MALREYANSLYFCFFRYKLANTRRADELFLFAYFYMIIFCIKYYLFYIYSYIWIYENLIHLAHTYFGVFSSFAFPYSWYFHLVLSLKESDPTSLFALFTNYLNSNRH